MIFLQTNDKHEVTLQHDKPFDEKYGLNKTKEQLELEGILVDSVPEPANINGKLATLYCNPKTKELWYEYDDIPKSPEELQAEAIKQLSERQDATDLAVLQLMMEGMK